MWLPLYPDIQTLLMFSLAIVVTAIFMGINALTMLYEDTANRNVAGMDELLQKARAANDLMSKALEKK